MQKGRNLVSHKAALQFVALRVFMPGMAMTALLLLAGMVLAATDSPYLGLAAPLMIGSFLLTAAASVVAYAVVYKHPRLARKEVEGIAEVQQRVIEIYEEGVASLSKRLAGLEQAHDQMFAKIWAETIAGTKGDLLVQLQAASDSLTASLKRLPREVMLRNQTELIEWHTALREGEVRRQELESMEIPDIPAEVLAGMMRATESSRQQARDRLQSLITEFKKRASVAREMLAQAQQLL